MHSFDTEEMRVEYWTSENIAICWCPKIVKVYCKEPRCRWLSLSHVFKPCVCINICTCWSIWRKQHSLHYEEACNRIIILEDNMEPSLRFRLSQNKTHIKKKRLRQRYMKWNNSSLHSHTGSGIYNTFPLTKMEIRLIVEFKSEWYNPHCSFALKNKSTQNKNKQTKKPHRFGCRECYPYWIEFMQSLGKKQWCIVPTLKAYVLYLPK